MIDLIKLDFHKKNSFAVIGCAPIRKQFGSLIFCPLIGCWPVMMVQSVAVVVFDTDPLFPITRSTFPFADFRIHHGVPSLKYQHTNFKSHNTKSTNTNTHTHTKHVTHTTGPKYHHFFLASNFAFVKIVQRPPGKI